MNILKKLGFKIDPQDIVAIAWMIIQRAVWSAGAQVYDDIKALAEEAQELPGLETMEKLERQFTKWKYVVTNFIADHDTIKEWDTELDIMLNIAVDEIKDRVDRKFKMPKWLRF